MHLGNLWSQHELAGQFRRAFALRLLHARHFGLSLVLQSSAQQFSQLNNAGPSPRMLQMSALPSALARRAATLLECENTGVLVSHHFLL
jgi:hypothetical protein